ncbi:circadian regulator timeout [Haemaphysalis longicornis]
MSDCVSSLVLSDIQAACSTLGGWDDGKYLKEPDCIESLKDILRYLRRDDEGHEIRRILGRIQVLKTDLLPLLKFYSDDDMLFDIVIRLLVDLMNPAILLYKEELPVEKFARNNYLEIISHLQSYKLAFTDSKVWTAITKKLEALLHKNWETRQEEDKDMIERILVLIRNVVHVPANPSEEKRTDDDVNVHDQVLWAMHLANLEDLLLYVTSSDDETDYCFHCLEILSLMLREQSPEVLARAEKPRTATEKDEDVRALLQAREVELARKKAQMQARTSRHPRFGGTFTVKNVKGIGESELVTHSNLAKLSQLSFDRSKQFKAKPKNRRPILEADDVTRRSTLNIRLFLKGLCTDFLKWCYNPMMRTVKSFLQRKKALSNDEGYYFWALKFFMEFNRHNGFDISLVSETISKETFHFVQTQLEQYYEMMVTDKRKIRIWSKRLHVGLKAYQELLRTLAAMDSSPDKAVREAARVLKGTIFYLPEYREIVLHLLLNYNEYVQPISYLRDLVEMVHVYMKMLQHFAKGHRHVIIKQKAKPRRKTTKKVKAKEDGQGAVVDKETQQQQWLEVSAAISVVIEAQEELPDDVVPYDSTLDNTEEEQKLDALSRIQAALRAQEAARAVALLRAAQELWPGQSMFGSQEDGTEFEALKDIFFSENKGLTPGIPPAENVPGEENEAPDAREEEDEEEAERAEERETEFNFEEFIARFANPKVVMAYCKLLAHYRTNSANTNRQVVRMLHRLAWDLKAYPLLFQVSVFKSFQSVLNDCRTLPPEMVDDTLKELARLATYVVRNFVSMAQSNKLAFAEILFWKSKKDVYELVHGYGATEKKSCKIAWTEEQVYELKVLYERYKDEATPESDVVDLILEHMIDSTRTRRSVLLQLKNLGLVDDVKAFKKTASAKCPWTGEDVIELQELFEKYQDSSDIMGQIMEHMSRKRPRHRIVDKLLELGLVRSRLELRKKASRKKGGPRTASGGGAQRSDESGRSSGDDIVDSSDDDDDRIYDMFRSGAPAVRPAQQKKKPSKSAPTFRTVPRTEVATSPEALRAVLGKLVEAGRQESIEWLQSSLEDALEDWDTESPSAVPLVPLLESHHLSMEDSDFCSLLRTMGIQPPTDEQEAYWRIPADMSSSMLNSRVNVLKKALEGDYGAPILVLGPAADAQIAGPSTSVHSDSQPAPDDGSVADDCRMMTDDENEDDLPTKTVPTPRKQNKNLEGLASLLRKKRERQKDSSASDDDDVGFARRNKRSRKTRRPSDDRAPEIGGGSTAAQEARSETERSEHRLAGSPMASASPGRLAAAGSPRPTERSKKHRRRAVLVVDSDEEHEFSRRSELVDAADNNDDIVIVPGDESSGTNGGSGARKAERSRLVVRDDSDSDDSTRMLDPFGADGGSAVGSNDVTRAVSPSDELERNAATPTISLDDDSAEGIDGSRGKSSSSPTRGASFNGASQQATLKWEDETVHAVEDNSDDDAVILEGNIARSTAYNKSAKVKRAMVISSDEEE